MTRRVPVLAALVAALALTGCGDSKSQPSGPATDPESVKKLEELQNQGRKGEK